MICFVAVYSSFAVVDKPTGIAVHRDEAPSSFFDAVREALGGGYLAPVHRLDKATSGLWLLARSPAAAAELSEQFARRDCEKYYLALSRHKPAKKQGRVAGALLKSRGGSYRLARSGKPWSETRFFSYGLGEGMRLFLLKPLTGRTHQLRVVMRSLGAPILGDSRYGPANEPADRCYLHAYALCFSLNGQRFRYTLPPQTGQYFIGGALHTQLAGLTEPWSLPWPTDKSVAKKENDREQSG